MMKVLYVTLGCKVNQYETEAIRERFEAAGYENAGEDDADIVIVNSCTVTAESDRKTRQLCRKYRHQFPCAAIVLTGCMAQAFPEEAAALDCADVVIGNRDAGLVLSKAEEFLRTHARIVDVSAHEKTDVYNTPMISGFEEHTRAFMKIEDGCQRYCSYCIIPTARGAVRSKPVARIETEAGQLSQNGYREIVLVGINLSSYGRDTGDSLCDAVSAVCATPGIARVRLGSLEPDLLSDADLRRLAAEPKFCPQFHLSLQSGCDSTLKRMVRHYDTAFYTDLVERIRGTFRNAAITTDVMVGFPGETQEEFTQSLNYVNKIGFARSHVFAYSRRDGTKAASMPGQVTRAEKSRRAKIMAEAARQSMLRFHESQVGQTANVLFEETRGGILSGYTENYTPVKVPGAKSCCGLILPVRITGILGDECTGELTGQDTTAR